MGKIVSAVAGAALIFFTAGMAAPFVASVWGAGAMSTMLTVANLMGLNMVVNGVLNQLSKRSKSGAGYTFEYSGTVEPRRIIYGQRRVSGMNVIPPVTSGSNNKMLHQVLAIAGHEVYAMPTVYFNQTALGTIASVTGASGDGLVSTGDFANKAWVRRYLGTSSQTADYILDNALSIWTTDHRGRGIAYVALQYEYDEKVYKQGKPEVSVLVQGKKIYDPRLDSTNGGSGSHRYNDPTTWAYSTNPALCLADYLMDATLGMGEDATRIDWVMVATAAAECDETVTIPTASTQARYTCNAVLMATNNYEENISILTSAMLGTCLYSGGKWRITAGSWGGTQFTLSDSDIIDGGVSIATAYPYKERYNGIRGAFIDPNNNYMPTEFPPTSSSTYVTDDGETVYKDISLEACTNVYEAQRTAILLARKSRNKESATVTCGMSAWRIRPGETGIITITEFGWSNKTVRCENWKFMPEGVIELTLREELSSDWNDPIEGDYLTPTNISNPTPVYFTPDAPGSFTTYGTKNGIVFNWTAPAILPSNSVFELWEYTSNTPFASASMVWEGYATSVTLPKGDLTTRYYWVRVRMPDGTTSSTTPSGNGLAGVASFVSDYGYLATGGCVVEGTSAVKTGGTASVWDSQVYSPKGYTTCHVSFKRNSATADAAVGLDANPSQDADLVNIDYCWYTNGSGTAYIYESNTNIGSQGTYTTATVFGITYDGSNVRYYMDGILKRTVALSSATLYMDSSFYTIGAGVNSLVYGPTTSFDLVETADIGANAATTTHLSSASGTTITQQSGTPVHSYTQSVVSVTLTPKVDCVLRCIFTGTLHFTNSYSSASSPQITVHAGSGTVRTYYPGNTAASATDYLTFSITHEISATAGTSITVNGGGAKILAGDTLVIDYCDLSVEEIKR